MRILIIDVEYLVALEAEQVLTDSLPCVVEIVMPRDALQALDNQAFHVVLADASVATGELGSALRRRFDQGAGLVFCSVIRRFQAGLPDFPGVPVVSKPFDDDMLVEIVRRVATQKSEEQPAGRSD